jgi:hypothetical protein
VTNALLGSDAPIDSADVVPSGEELPPQAARRAAIASTRRKAATARSRRPGTMEEGT